MRSQTIEHDDYIWAQSRLGYLIGEALIQRFAGCLKINSTPESRTFLRYMVGEFAAAHAPSAMVDPFGVARVYLDTGPGRDLETLLEEVGTELINSGP